MALNLASLVRPRYSRARLIAAVAVALAVDAAQLLLGPLGWAGFDDVMDVAAMAALTAILGFHVLFLPAFVVELVPVADMLPTWTGAVLAVAMLRRRDPSAA